MKTLKPFILVSLLLSASLATFACGPWYYSAAENDIYRILPYGVEGPALQLNPDFSKQNILLWSRQTRFPDTASIRQALYDQWPLYGQWEDLLSPPHSSLPTPHSSLLTSHYPPFVRHLLATGDTVALRLLCWSKMYSNIRNAQRSPWYYNSRLDTDETRQLRKLFTQLQHYTPTKKYAHRFLFLAIKCSWAIGNDTATLALWERTNQQLKGSIFYSEAEDYVARTLLRMGRDKEAYRSYLRRGDIGSLLQLKQLRLPELLDLLLRIDPESPVIPVELQRMLFSLENGPVALEHKICTGGYLEHKAILPIALRAAQSTVPSRRAMWGYVAACLLDYQHKPLAALRQLEAIDTLPCDDFLKRNTRVLRFYLRSKTDTIGDDFERYAIGELKWMDNELQREWKNLPEAERYKMSRMYGVGTGDMFRSCYMYDAMRRILLPDTVGLCQRLAASGRHVRALQMANLAENRFFILTNNKVVQQMRAHDTSVCYTWERDEHPGFEWPWYDWREIDTVQRESYWGRLRWNNHDYSNWMFLLADKMNAHQIESYRRRITHPLDGDDRWFNARGYTDSDYWQDIVGTHCLRECNYPAAVDHLKLVSSQYQQRMNINFNFNPFGFVSETPSNDSTLYKLHFAQRMAALQKQMSQGDPDSRGLAMLEYSIGMRNSFGLCWYLTTYGHSWYEPDFGSEWYPRTLEQWQYDNDPVQRLMAFSYPYKEKFIRRADCLQRKALSLLLSDEAKAKAHLRLGHYSKVMNNWPYTSVGRHIALVCDQWSLYYPSFSEKYLFTKRAKSNQIPLGVRRG